MTPPELDDTELTARVALRRDQIKNMRWRLAPARRRCGLILDKLDLAPPRPEPFALATPLFCNAAGWFFAAACPWC
jgi:hypothetical protein